MVVGLSLETSAVGSTSAVASTFRHDFWLPPLFAPFPNLCFLFGIFFLTTGRCMLTPRSYSTWLSATGAAADCQQRARPAADAKGIKVTHKKEKERKGTSAAASPRLYTALHTAQYFATGAREIKALKRL